MFMPSATASEAASTPASAAANLMSVTATSVSSAAPAHQHAFASSQSEARRSITFQDLHEAGQEKEEETGEAPNFDAQQFSHTDFATTATDKNVVLISSSQGSSQSDTKTSSLSSQSASLSVKRMKAASDSSQFYTTIVVKVCVTCREWKGSVSSDSRASFVFRRVEIGLRDRVAFPLPSTVTIKELMENSYFQGIDAEDNYRKFCQDEEEPLTKEMIAIGTNL
jgi:hypothetical protein